MKNLLLIIFLVCSSLVYGQSKETKLEQLFEAYYQAGNFNGTALVSQNGKILLNRGYGLKSIKDSLPNESTTIFQIGSITKQFTAAAILQLQEDNKLNVQDKLSKYFPDYPKGDSITIEHLLTHTSGIHNYTNNPALETEAVKPTSQENMIASFKDKPLNFSPGSSWAYSNSGYMLLGYIIEKVSKMPYERYMRESIFNPLGMKSTGFDFAHSSNPNKARGYNFIKGSEFKESVVVDSSVSYAAGAIYSTTGDLYKWHKGLLDNKILEKASLQKALTPKKEKYGYGWGIDTLYGKQISSHGGAILGFNTDLVRIPEDDVLIVLLNNMSNPQLGKIRKDALAILYDKPYNLPEVKKEIALSPDILAQYVGVYQLAPTFSITITQEGKNLFAQATGQPRFQLFAQKEDYFFLKVVDAQVEFSKDENGKIASLTLFQGGQKIPGKKVE